MITVRNWTRFQHYKNRRPPWIKLHADILSNRGWHALTGDEAKLLVELWLVAADLSNDGTISLETPDLAFRLRRDSNMLATHIKSLCDKGFLDSASTVLASAVPETERETEEIARSAPAKKKRRVSLPADWTPTDSHKATALGDGLDIDFEARKFRAHAEANDRKMVSWNAAFAQWLTQAAQWQTERRPKRNGGPPPFWTPEEVEALG